MDTVGSRIRRIRELRGLSQKELATRAGIHEVLMRRYEYGDRNPKPAQLAKIADALCVSESIFICLMLPQPMRCLRYYLN